MTDLIIASSITRPELGLTDLNLHDGVAYKTVSVGPGTRVRRNSYNKSGNAHGGTLNNSVLDSIIRPAAIRVLAASQSQLDSRTETLIEAFEQSSYHWTLTKNGQATTYDCMTTESIGPATPDGQSQDEWDKYQLMAFQHVYRIAVPTQPQPLAGPI